MPRLAASVANARKLLPVPMKAASRAAAGRALVVPDSVIGTEQSLKFAYTVSSSNTVEKRFVVPGPLVHGKRIILSGLKEGERVIVNGTLRVLFAGQPVQPQEASAAAPSTPKAGSAH